MNDLHQLYHSFGDPEDENGGYQKVFSYVAQDILSDASTQFDAYSFFQNRTQIGDYMWEKLRDEFDANYYADVVRLALLGL
eukprot:SAG31_NODE_2294_length_5991_cov_2.589613_5_plen_81_part_00